jgi:hypothetical protein
MTDRTIHITEFDNKRLRDLLAEARYTNYRGSEYLKGLEHELTGPRWLIPKLCPPTWSP